MLNQFLFNENPDIQGIKKFKPDEVKINVENIKETSNYLLKVSIQGDNEKSANSLDEFQEKLLKEYSDIIVLSSESSKYYNRRLYPLINDMERNLRHLLFLANTLMGKDDGTLLKNLEKMDFGEIYELLFIDTEFMSFARGIFKKGKIGSFNSNSFSKRELVEFLDSKEESILWDKILNAEAVPTLKNNFTEIRDYRNEVMHAHNINQKCYKKARKIYIDINIELEDEIRKIETSPVSEINKNISKIMSSTLASINAINLERITRSLSDVIVKLVQSPQFNNLNEMASKLWATPSIIETAEKINKLSIIDSDYFESMKNTLESIQLPRIDIDKNFNDMENDVSDEDIDELEDDENKKT